MMKSEPDPSAFAQGGRARGLPPEPWEQSEVRQVWAQVEAGSEDRDVRLDAHLLPIGGGCGNGRSRPTSEHDVPFRLELRVRADDDAARDRQVVRERAGGGQAGADRQLVRSDQRSQALLDLQPERPPPVELQCEKWSC